MKRNTSRLFQTLFVLVLFSTSIVSCGPSAPAEEPAETEGIRVVVVINGVLGDKSFFDSAERGMVMAEEDYGITYKTIEAGTDPANWQPAFADAAENEEYDMLIVGTWQMVDFLQEIAPQHPDKKFVIFDSAVDYEACDCGNVYSVLYKQNEGSYLAGVYGAAMTTQAMDGMNEDPIIGVVGGSDIPVINDFIVGYKQGAVDTNPDTQVIVQYPASDNPWNDPAKGKEITLAMYQQGADIVFNVAGGTGQGIFEAAKEQQRWAIGVDSDQALILKDSNPDQADRILTSMMKNVDLSLHRAIGLYLEDKLAFGEAEYLGIREQGVGLARNEFYDKHTPDEVKALVEEAEQKILDGEITVETVF